MMRNEMTQSSRGQALIEFALVVPILVLLVLGLFDLGYAVYAQNAISNAAREGARTGIILTKTDADIRSRVLATAPTLASLQITIAPSLSRTANTPITVTVNYTFTPMTPVIGQLVGSGIPLSARSVMIVEGVTQ